MRKPLKKVSLLPLLITSLLSSAAWASPASEESDIANNLARQGCYDSAVMFYEKALRLSPNYEPAIAGRNAALRLMGKGDAGSKKGHKKDQKNAPDSKVAAVKTLPKPHPTAAADAAAAKITAAAAVPVAHPVKPKPATPAVKPAQTAAVPAKPKPAAELPAKPKPVQTAAIPAKPKPIQAAAVPAKPKPVAAVVETAKPKPAQAAAAAAKPKQVVSTALPAGRTSAADEAFGVSSHSSQVEAPPPSSAIPKLAPKPATPKPAAPKPVKVAPPVVEESKPAASTANASANIPQEPQSEDMESAPPVSSGLDTVSDSGIDPRVPNWLIGMAVGTFLLLIVLAVWWLSPTLSASRQLHDRLKGLERKER